MKISLITIVNKKDIYEEFLKNLKKQINIEYELLPIFNYNNEYKSARKAFNSVAKKARGTYLFFLHPDIRFMDNQVLANMIQEVEKIKNFGVIGIAGAKRKGKTEREIVTTIIQGFDAKKVGRYNYGIEEVQTVDECLFIISRDFFNLYPFSENVGWHLYAVEYCLQALRNGRSNYVIPANIWHLSDGKSLDPNYVKQINKLIKNEKDNFDLICTTVKAWPTRGFFSYIYRKYYLIKQKIKKLWEVSRCFLVSLFPFTMLKTI